MSDVDPTAEVPSGGRNGARIAAIAVGVVLLLLGFGMYLGRYLRLNSWDIKHPIGFLRRIVEHFSAWERVWACVGFTLTYAAFLGFIYLIIGGMYIDTLSTLEASKGSL